MVRGKVQMRRIENPVHRQVTFCKRRAGLLKKATELSVLCDADVGIIIFSPRGKLYQLATNGTMERLIERYRMTSGEARCTASNDVNRPHQEAEQEISMLKKEIDLLHKGISHMLGGKGSAGGTLTLDELLALEKNLEFWMYQIRSSKIMFQEIQSLKNKEGILKAANEVLQEKIEQSGVFDLSPAIVQQTEHFDAAPLTADLQHPLTLQDEYLDFGDSIMRFSY